MITKQTVWVVKKKVVFVHRHQAEVSLHEFDAFLVRQRGIVTANRLAVVHVLLRSGVGLQLDRALQHLGGVLNVARMQQQVAKHVQNLTIIRLDLQCPFQKLTQKEVF
jgi:hypothetical protein